MKLSKLIGAVLSASFISRTKKENQFLKLPLELRHEIISFLGLELHNLTRTCSLFAHDVRTLIHSSIAKVNPRFCTVNHVFNFALFAYHLDSLREIYPNLNSEEISLIDVVEFCHFKAQTGANEMVKKSAALLKKRHGHPFDHGVLETYVFQEGLLLTAELLLSTQKLSQESYYKLLIAIASSSDKPRFMKRALRFEDPVSLLKLKFNSDFAWMLFENSDADIKLEVIKFLAEKENFSSNMVSGELVDALVSYPDQLCRALERSKETRWTIRLWSKLSEEERSTINLPEKLQQRIYIICLKSFDAKEFSEKVPFSIEAVKLFPELHLCEPCHFEAFADLITHERADFSAPDSWDSNMLTICWKCEDVPQYWRLFLEHSRTFPPLRIGPETFSSGKSLSVDQIKSLAPKMSLIDFLVFSTNVEMKSFIHSKDIPMHLTVNCFDIVPIGNPIRDILPPELNSQISWPLLHLAIILINVPAYEAILSHSLFCPQTIDATVNDYSIFKLFVFIDRLNVRVNHFRNILYRRFGRLMDLPDAAIYSSDD